MIKQYRSLVSSSIGNILEWYDFGLFAIYSVLFSQLFFPHTNSSNALIETFSVFAVGFICRPIGSLIFGYLGDRQGRARTLRMSILMISLPTLLIGFLPTYENIGMLAPIMLTLIRIWQGISVGGEFSGNVIYLAETAPSDHRAVVTSLASTGANLGILLATIIGSICARLFPDDVFQQWGWRIPYLLSGILSLVIYSTRLNLDETKVFQYMQQKKCLAQNPIKTMFQDNLLYVLRIIGLVCLGSTFYYFCFIYIPLYLSQNLGFSISRVSLMMSCLFALMLVLVPLAGYLCDYLGRRKMLIFNASAVVLLVVPGYALMQTAHWMIVFSVMLLFTIISSLEQATTSIAVVENYPIPARYTGLSFGYNLGNGILGGTVPVVCAWLLNHFHSNIAPAFYIAGCAMITAIVAYLFVPETKNSSLV